MAVKKKCVNRLQNEWLHNIRMQEIQTKSNFIKVRLQNDVSSFLIITFLRFYTHRVHYWNGIVYIVTKCR